MCGVCLLVISKTFIHQLINQFLFQAQQNGMQSQPLTIVKEELHLKNQPSKHLPIM